LGDVAQPDQAAIGDEIHRQDILLGFECARYAQGEPLVAGLQDPGWADNVLRRQGGSQSRPVDPETRELLNREFDEYLFVLSAEDLYFCDVRHLHQTRTDILDVVFQLAMGEPIRSDAVDDPKNITEFVVESRTDHTGWQGVANVADAFANVVPNVGNLCGGGLPLQVDEDGGLAGARVAAQKIEARRFLKGALKPVGELLEGVVQGGARPSGLYDHRLDDEGRVLVSPQAEEGCQSGDRRRDHDVDDE
jgi:hypothetical protein